MYSLVKKLSFLIDDRRFLSDIFDWVYYLQRTNFEKRGFEKAPPPPSSSSYILPHKVLIG